MPTQITTAPDTGLTLEQLRESYAIHLNATKAPKTRAVYLDALDLFTRFLREKGMPATVTGVRREHVEAWIIHLREPQPTGRCEGCGARGGASQGGVSNRTRSLRAFFKWALEEDEIKADPMEKVRIGPVPVTPPPVLRDDEVERIRKAALRAGSEFERRRNVAIVELLLGSGIRRGELLGLTMEDTGSLGQFYLQVTGKGRRARLARVSATAAKAVDRYLRVRRPHPYAALPALFLGKRGPLGETGLREVLEKIGRLAGVENLHPHRFRHTYAHEWLVRGGTEGGLMQQAGWTTREMLNRYGASAATERALDEATRLSIGDRRR